MCCFQQDNNLILLLDVKPSKKDCAKVSNSISGESEDIVNKGILFYLFFKF